MKYSVDDIRKSIKEREKKHLNQDIPMNILEIKYKKTKEIVKILKKEDIKDYQNYVDLIHNLVQQYNSLEYEWLLDSHLIIYTSAVRSVDGDYVNFVFEHSRIPTENGVKIYLRDNGNNKHFTNSIYFEDNKTKELYDVRMLNKTSFHAEEKEISKEQNAFWIKDLVEIIEWED